MLWRASRRLRGGFLVAFFAYVERIVTVFHDVEALLDIFGDARMAGFLFF